MTLFEEMEQQAQDEDIKVVPFDLSGTRIGGLYCDGTIALNDDLETTAEKSCVLTEELGHHYTSTGNIIDLTDPNSRKQECRARLWGYNRLIGLVGIIKAFEHGCRSRYEMAEFLGVTEEFLDDALKAYQSKYGVCTTVDNYTIYFMPSLAVVRIGD